MPESAVKIPKPVPAPKPKQSTVQGGGLSAVKGGGAVANKDALAYLEKYKQKNGGANSSIKAVKIAPANIKTPKEKTDAKEEPVKAIDKSNTTNYLASLHTQPPTAFIKAMKNADADTNSIHSKEKTALQSELPIIDQPTGLPTLDKAGGGKGVGLDAANAAAMKRKTGSKAKKLDTNTSFAVAKPVVKAPAQLNQKKVEDPGIFPKNIE
jgi:hypothetical protein